MQAEPQRRNEQHSSQRPALTPADGKIGTAVRQVFLWSGWKPGDKIVRRGKLVSDGRDAVAVYARCDGLIAETWIATIYVYEKAAYRGLGYAKRGRVMDDRRLTDRLLRVMDMVDGPVTLERHFDIVAEAKHLGWWVGNDSPAD